MRAFLIAAVFFFTNSTQAQFYYKDIIGTKESSGTLRNYMNSKVTRVVLTSFDKDGQKDADFYVMQEFAPATRTLKTISRSGSSRENYFFSIADAQGNVIRTIDSSSVIVTETQYYYNGSGQLMRVVSASSDSAKTSSEVEEHIWTWSNGKPSGMRRIKNKADTSFVNFKLDENGNVIEEQETRKKTSSFPFLYYYNGDNRLSDIVRFNPRAGLLLPEYMFEYSASGDIIQKITVPSNNSEYLIWRYQFNNQGLKVKEAVYDKQKRLLGKIEYQYSFGS